MKLSVPIDVDVNLTPDEICKYIKDWLYSILEEHKQKNFGWCNSKAIVKDDKLYWKYQETIGQDGDTFLTKMKYEPINIVDEKVFNLCKAGVELLEAYSEIHAKSKYAYINGCI